MGCSRAESENASISLDRAKRQNFLQVRESPQEDFDNRSVRASLYFLPESIQRFGAHHGRF